MIGRDSSPRRTVLYTVAVVLIIGIGWEVFEYVYGLTDATESKYYMDVVHDLISDTLGAIGAYLWAGRSSEYSTMRSNG